MDYMKLPYDSVFGTFIKDENDRLIEQINASKRIINDDEAIVMFVVTKFKYHANKKLPYHVETFDYRQTDDVFKVFEGTVAEFFEDRQIIDKL